MLPPFAIGTIPESLGNLVMLKELYLSYNRLSGRFLSIFWDGQSRTTNLFFAVFAHFCHREHPRVFWGSQEVDPFVSIRESAYRSLFSPFLGWSVPYDQPNFGYFLLTFAAGSIPESMGNLGNLEGLYLSSNHLTGFFSFFLGGRSRTTNLIVAAFCPFCRRDYP